jgi:hypothetical protein
MGPLPAREQVTPLHGSACSTRVASPHIVPLSAAMSSFDQSLKHLLHSRPEDFIRFGLGDPSIELLEPAEAALPARPSGNRDVDGGYRFRWDEELLVGHVEFHRRHTSRKSLALDVGEAQIRFHRREGLRVVSFVWDLYGKADEPLLARRRYRYGASDEAKKPASQVTYRRVNLRALGYEALLSSAPPTLWPLVALTHDGATEAGVKAARNAIVARRDLREGERADHLAVLRFVGERENVAIAVLEAYISERELMASTAIVEVLRNWLGKVDPAVRERLRALSDLETLTPWFMEALAVRDVEGARRLAKEIRSARVAEAAAP